LIDSVLVKGNAKISKKYLQNYLSIKPDDVYNETEIRAISTKVKEIPFISEIKPSEAIFIKDRAKIYLYLNKRKASQFNGIIGVMPNDKTTGKLLINGELKLKLLSAFGRGELIDFYWKSIEKGTQDLSLNFAYPYLFSTPFGIDYKFSLYKKDTSYMNLNNNIGIQYLFSTLSYIKAFAEILSSSIIKASGLENATVLPDYADMSSTLYGIELAHEKLDYRFNPRKGFFFKVSAAAGLKKIKENDKINPILYDSIQLTSNQYKLTADAGIFIPLLKRHTFYFNTKDGYIINNNLFENELFKIGGLKTLKGFDEESIHASMFTILTFEYRFLFDQNSYFCVFANAAYYEKRLHNSFACDSPYGFGAGVNFETKIGIFSLYYALGSEFGNSIEFKQAKIHFGITSYF
jgi:outer membrane protein assembly factor BamA